MKLHSLAALLACTFVAGCSTADVEDSPAAPFQRWADQPAPALYARDGSVVQGPESAKVAGATPASATDVRRDPTHDVGARDGSRMYLLELYQKAVEERESLTREVKSLQSALTKVGESQATLEKERDLARAEIEKLRTELDKSRGDNQELAGRLLTAQIRRLEAEKLLLETRIDTLQHAQVEGGPDDAGGPLPAPMKPAAKPASAPHGGQR